MRVFIYACMYAAGKHVCARMFAYQCECTLCLNMNAYAWLYSINIISFHHGFYYYVSKISNNASTLAHFPYIRNTKNSDSNHRLVEFITFNFTNINKMHITECILPNMKREQCEKYLVFVQTHAPGKSIWFL